ncbi:RHS repeat-associated core domain-containing protein [Shewanella decolorationis]|uniref:RHS repeat-associated core domain-containing protein n=1 Tax=Shewanella decolorationis TaxID=256839 RepID=UPI0020C91FCD
MQDKDLGLTYMQARYYDPLIGRFYSNDPVGFWDVHSFNRYAYANNNPYKYVDPDGKTALAACATGPVGCGVGLAITGLTILVASRSTDVDETIKIISEGSFDTENVGTNPTTGEPGCVSTCNGKTGKAKQIRIYGPDGKPKKDIDVDHPHDGKKPHAHDWKDGRRTTGDEVRDITPDEQKLIDDLIIPPEQPETSA